MQRSAFVNRYLIAQRPPRFVINTEDDWDVHRNCRVNNNPKIVCCQFFCTYYL